jgi:hypothetical protein
MMHEDILALGFMAVFTLGLFAAFRIFGGF